MFDDGDMCMRERVRLCDSIGFSSAHACVFATEIHDWHYKEVHGNGSATIRSAWKRISHNSVQSGDWPSERIKLSGFEPYSL